MLQEVSSSHNVMDIHIGDSDLLTSIQWVKSTSSQLITSHENDGLRRATMVDEGACKVNHDAQVERHASVESHVVHIHLLGVSCSPILKAFENIPLPTSARGHCHLVPCQNETGNLS